jgi:hypothetical protein
MKWKISDYWEIFKYYILKCNGYYPFLSFKNFKNQASLRLKCRLLKEKRIIPRIRKG